MCDWHYEKQPGGLYPSVDVFADAGVRMLLSPMKSLDNARAFIDYAIAHDRGHIDGLLMTTWFGSGELARHMLHGEPGKWKWTEELSATIRALFE